MLEIEPSHDETILLVGVFSTLDWVPENHESKTKIIIEKKSDKLRKILKNSKYEY